MKEIIVDGIPVLIRENERPPRIIRIKIKKPGRKPLKDLPFSKLDSRQKQALKNFASLGCDPKRKKEAGEAAGYSDEAGAAVRAVDRLLERKSIVKKIEKVCQADHKKDMDQILAEVMVECLFATHPMSKENKKDYKAIVKAVSEMNKVADNYPAKKIDVRELGFHVHFTEADVRAAKQYRELTKDDEDS